MPTATVPSLERIDAMTHRIHVAVNDAALKTEFRAVGYDITLDGYLILYDVTYTLGQIISLEENYKVTQRESGSVLIIDWLGL
jgi:hypothetical protein